MHATDRRSASVGNAHPNLSVVDARVSRDDIARFYSEDHARVWELIRQAGLAGASPPPVFEAVAYAIEVAGYRLEARGHRVVEPGWLPHAPMEQQRLARELPGDPDVLARLGQAVIPGCRPVVRKAMPSEDLQRFDPATLIAAMRRAGIGRPSTYARHVQKVFDSVNRGLLRKDADGRFRMAHAGFVMLEALADPALPSLDVAYSAELERDLEAIEQGDADPAAVVRRHLARIPGLNLQDADQQDGQGDTHEGTAPQVPHGGHDDLGVHQLPPGLDPALALPAGHPLRGIRGAFDETARRLLGGALPNRQEAMHRRACRATAVCRICSVEPAAVLERLRRDLGWRWVVDLAPTDPVWTPEQLDAMTTGREEFVRTLASAGTERVGEHQRL
ncbi:MAG: DNA topoisomerase [Myxococcales bacterium]|nr:DNA topoisomerase [Myxococcales bacterium]